MATFSPFKRSPAIGGVTLLNPQHYIIWLALAFLASISLVNSKDSISTLTLWALAHLAGFAGSAIWFLLFRVVVFKNRVIQPIRSVWVYLFGFFLGFVKGVGTGAAGNAVNLDFATPGEVLLRGISAGLISGLTVPALAFVEYRRRQYQRDLDLLIAQDIQADLGEANAASNKGKTGSSLAELREHLESLRQTVSLAEYPFEMRSKLPIAIRELADDIVRPLSHKLWEIESRARNDFSLGTLAKLALAAKPKPTAPYLAVFFIVLLVGHQLEFSLTESFFRSIIGTAILGAIELISVWFKPKHLPFRVFTEVVWMSLAVLLINLINSTIFSSSLDQSNFDSTIALLIWLLELRFIFGVFSAANQAHNTIQAQLKSAIGTIRRKSMAEAAADRFKNRSLANLLHGQVQNSLLSASLRLESGSVSKHELQVEIDSLIKLLDTPIRIGANQLSQGVPFSQGMQEITHRWRGFAAISFNNFSIISEVPDLNTNLLLELLEEAVANAVRHGLADSVVVELDSTPKNRLSISVIDNGVGPRAGKFGLGSALFEIVSGGNWSLTAQPEGGSKLEIQFDNQAEFNPR